MTRKKLFFIVVFVISAGVALALSPSPFMLAETRNCSHSPQASKVTVVLSDLSSMTLTPISFAKEFCIAPIVVAAGGENVDMIQIGVVTSGVAWLLVYGTPGNEVTVTWQAMEPTQ